MVIFGQKLSDQETQISHVSSGEKVTSPDTHLSRESLVRLGKKL